MTNNLLILFTHHPNHPLTEIGLRFVKTYLKQNNHQTDTTKQTPPNLNVFFYGESAHLANRLHWQPANQPNLTQDWQQLADCYGLDLPVCVSTALSRGISDQDNSQRHQLTAENLAKDFRLVGLSELATLLHQAQKVLQF